MSAVILTAAEMRAAEAETIAGGTSVETLMERAGRAAAEAIWRFAGPIRALVLCGPGNNGGDGYVIACALREKGVKVRVASIGEPQSGAAKKARQAWGDSIETLAEAGPAPLLIDALFGTGLTRPLDRDLASRLESLAAGARVRVAIDLPSGIASDDGLILSPVPDFDLTITFQTLKPSHLLQPAARHMGRLVVADIGISACSNLTLIEPPRLRQPGPDDHKYRRGYVAIFGGDLPGAAALTASAAARAGAGYVSLASSQTLAGVPSAVVQGGRSASDLMADERVGAVVIGPGLGRSDAARRLLDQALTCGHPLVLDADALNLLAERGPAELPPGTIITPHAGEFARLFPDLHGSKVEQAREGADRSNAVIVFKGPDTVVAMPGGRSAIARPAPHWLASAGTGDVLTGIIAALRASGLEPFDAACSAVWLHGEAARLAGEGLIADDLVERLPFALHAAL